MSMPSSVTSVSPVSSKLGLALVSHILNIGDLVLRDQHQYLMQQCIERQGVSWCHYYALDPLSQIVIDMLNFRHVLWANWPVNAHNIVFADSSEVCSRIVILGLVLSLVFAQKAGQQTSTPHPCTLDWLSAPLQAPDLSP